jgi:hypothetical protein
VSHWRAHERPLTDAQVAVVKVEKRQIQNPTPFIGEFNTINGVLFDDDVHYPAACTPKPSLRFTPIIENVA